MNEFIFRCDSPDFFSNEDCIKDVYKQAGIEETLIKQCMKDSGGTSDDKQNSILEDQIAAAKDMGVVIIPTAFVNESAIRGKLSFATLFSAVCSGYVAGSQPDICAKCITCHDQEGCAAAGACRSRGGDGRRRSGVSTSTFVITILCVCMAFGVAGFLHWQKSQRDMRDQVKGILAEYMPLESDDGEIGPAMDFARRVGSTEIS